MGRVGSTPVSRPTQHFLVSGRYAKPEIRLNRGLLMRFRHSLGSRFMKDLAFQYFDLAGSLSFQELRRRSLPLPKSMCFALP